MIAARSHDMGTVYLHTAVGHHDERDGVDPISPSLVPTTDALGDLVGPVQLRDTSRLRNPRQAGRRPDSTVSGAPHGRRRVTAGSGHGDHAWCSVRLGHSGTFIHSTLRRMQGNETGEGTKAESPKDGDAGAADDTNADRNAPFVPVAPNMRPDSTAARSPTTASGASGKDRPRSPASEDGTGAYLECMFTENETDRGWSSRVPAAAPGPTSVDVASDGDRRGISTMCNH